MNNDSCPEDRLRSGHLLFNGKGSDAGLSFGKLIFLRQGEEKKQKDEKRSLQTQEDGCHSHAFRSSHSSDDAGFQCSLSDAELHQNGFFRLKVQFLCRT